MKFKEAWAGASSFLSCVRAYASHSAIDDRPCEYMLPPLSWIVPHRRERRVVLDRVGSQMWRQCDGERTVEAVIDAFAATHDLTFHEARVAVTTYIKSLVKRGVLVIVMPKEQAG